MKRPQLTSVLAYIERSHTYKEKSEASAGEEREFYRLLSRAHSAWGLALQHRQMGSDKADELDAIGLEHWNDALK